jgi:hypothetical protein
MKGIFTICNILNDSNKLGNIIDFTSFIENIKFKKAYMDVLMKEDFGDTFSIINSYNIPNHIIKDYDVFKKWFINTVWKAKDNILDKLDNNKINYKELVPNMKSYEYMILIVCVTLFFYLAFHTSGLFIPVSLLISYLMMYKTFRTLKKEDKKSLEQMLINTLFQ